MSSFFIVEPEVPGGLGPRTQLDRSVHPPLVHLLHFVFDGWLGDHLVTSFPCYLVTSRLARLLTDAGVNGFELADVEVETSEQFNDSDNTRELPEFKWLRIVGKPNTNDMFISPDYRLSVSQKALSVILSTNPSSLDYCKYT